MDRHRLIPRSQSRSRKNSGYERDVFQLAEGITDDFNKDDYCLYKIMQQFVCRLT